MLCVALGAPVVDETRAQTVLASMWRRQTLFNAWEKNTNGIRIGTVVDRCRYRDIGISQNGISIRHCGDEDPDHHPDRGALSSQIVGAPTEASRRAAPFRSSSDVLEGVRVGAALVGSIGRLQRRAQGGNHDARQPAQGGLEHREEVEVVAPQRDSPVVHLEHAADPELQPQSRRPARRCARSAPRRPRPRCGGTSPRSPPGCRPASLTVSLMRWRPGIVGNPTFCTRGHRQARVLRCRESCVLHREQESLDDGLVLRSLLGHDH